MATLDIFPLIVCNNSPLLLGESFNGRALLRLLLSKLFSARMGAIRSDRWREKKYWGHDTQSYIIEQHIFKGILEFLIHSYHQCRTYLVAREGKDFHFPRIFYFVPKRDQPIVVRLGIAAICCNIDHDSHLSLELLKVDYIPVNILTGIQNIEKENISC